MAQFDAILVDAGTGNLHSVHNALNHLGAKILVTSDPSQIPPGMKIILPGVGAFAAFMEGVKKRKLIQPLESAYQTHVPILGICVGMQALFELGEEMGTHAGLGLIKGKVIRFPDFSHLKVPHTGWNQLWFQKGSPLFSGLPSGCYAYFNHSYFCAPTDPSVIAATTDYGINFSSAVQMENLYGVQFHPEKSQRIGLKILENFLRI